MPTPLQVAREERRGVIGFLHALGFGPAVIVDVLARGGKPVSIRTVAKDLAAIRERGGQPLDGPAATAQIRAVYNQLWAPIQGVLASGKDGDEVLTLAQKVGLTHDIWGAYLSRVNFEQAFGAMPKKPEEVSIELQVSKDVEELLTSILGRIGNEAAVEVTGAMQSIHVERHKLLERLGFTP